MDYGYLFESEPAGYVIGVNNFLRLRPVLGQVGKKNISNLQAFIMINGLEMLRYQFIITDCGSQPGGRRS